MTIDPEEVLTFCGQEAILDDEDKSSVSVQPKIVQLSPQITTIEFRSKKPVRIPPRAASTMSKIIADPLLDKIRETLGKNGALSIKFKCDHSNPHMFASTCLICAAITIDNEDREKTNAITRQKL